MCTREGRTESALTRLALIRELVPALVVLFLCSPDVASTQQRYRVDTNKVLIVSGDVKKNSCGGKCVEGHDCSTCVGVRVTDEYDNHQTAVYDKTACCDDCGKWDFHFAAICGFPGHDCPANQCPSNSSNFSVPVGGLLRLMPLEGRSFYVPSVTAVIGNLSNNNWTCGSMCSASDFFQPYAPFGRVDASWGGFWDVCPNPTHPELTCTPVEDDGSYRLLAPHAIAPAGGAISLDGGPIRFEWSQAHWDVEGPEELEPFEYRVIVNGEEGVIIDERVPQSACGYASCVAHYTMPEAGRYSWWVEARALSDTSPPSKALTFNLAVVTTCGGAGGYCAEPLPPDFQRRCAEGDIELGQFYECDLCCQPNPVLPTCQQLGGNLCSDPLPCPAGSVDLGVSWDCAACCKTCVSTGCPAGSCGVQVDNCGRSIWCGECQQSCGAMGGDTCSQSGACPAGYNSLGRSSDCNPCCQKGPSCGAMGGNYCSPTASCPGGATFLGISWDCAGCCKTCVSTGCPPGSCGVQVDNCGRSIWCGECQQSCGAMGGDTCSQSGACPAGYNSLGRSSDCNPCCQQGPSCGAIGGDTCSQGGWCPENYTDLGRTWDCNPCCVSQ